MIDSELDGRVRTAIDEAVADRDIAVSVSLINAAGAMLAIDEHRSHYAASTMKLAVLVATWRERDAGRLDLTEPILVHQTFRSRTGASFELDPADDSDQQVWARLGEPVGLEWLCRRMITRSSNLATDLVLERLGFGPVEEAVAACGGSAGEVRVQRMIGDFAAQAAGWSNEISTAGLAAILAALSAVRCAAAATCSEVLEILAANEVGTDVRAGLPAGVWVAHKNGWVSDAVHDAALVRPDGRDVGSTEFVLVVASSGGWAEEAEGHRLIAAIAGLVWASRVGR